MEPDNLRRSWGRIRASAGLGGMRLHDMRHTCVSLLLDLGVPPHVVREIVGHSDIEVTMTVYAHAALDEKRAALPDKGWSVVRPRWGIGAPHRDHRGCDAGVSRSPGGRRVRA